MKLSKLKPLLFLLACIAVMSAMGFISAEHEWVWGIIISTLSTIAFGFIAVIYTAVMLLKTTLKQQKD